VGQILQKVAPLLIAPFVAGQFCRFCMPKVSGWVAAHSQISFYIWLLSLIVIIGRTTCFILDYNDADRGVEITLAVVALVICVVQFVAGRALGRRYGDAAAGGQSLGQKNTVLAVWISQAFLDPIASVAPTAYIVWQNLVNSYQIYRFGEGGQKSKQVTSSGSSK
jgi:BASS family bile acid:Na+ symporter